MGMDGLSMANTGMLREATSRDYSMQTEETISKNEENKQVDQVSTQMKVKEDGHNSASRENDNQEKNENDDSTEDNNDDESNLNISKDDLDNHTFYVKITKDGQLFELYDKESDRLVEKISAEEINQLMLKLNMASGILVNRSV